MFFGKEKNTKPGFFSLRSTVFLLIILTCILTIGNIIQDILFDIQPSKTIEVTREITYMLVVTATPDYAYGQTPCNRYDLLRAIERGGDVIFDCNTVVLIDEPIVIRNSVHLVGSSELLTILSQGQDLSSLFIIESGGNLALENFGIRDIHGRVLEIHQGGSFSGRNCRIAGSGRADMVSSLIYNEGSLQLSQCVIESNRMSSGAMLWQGQESLTSLSSTVFRANQMASGDFTGEGRLIENSGGVLNIDTNHFLDTVGQNANNWIIRSRSGESNLGRSFFRNNQFSMTGVIIENEANSMMYMDSVSMLNNSIFRGVYIQNAGNLRILNAGIFNGTCINTGLLNDFAGQCHN
jgi:hypothetical protein